MQCKELRKIIDSYLSDELLVETNHEVLRHLENCTGCRSDLAALKDFRSKVRSAVMTSEEFKIDGRFSSNVITGLQSAALRPTLLERIARGRVASMRSVAIAFACLLLIALGTTIWVTNFAGRGTEKDNANSALARRANDRPTNTISAEAIRVSWTEMTHDAVGDHENCALEFRLPERPISLDEAAEKYGAFNKDLGTTVVAAIDNSPFEEDHNAAEFCEAHSCVFAGRRFSHVVLKVKGKILSVLISDSDVAAVDDSIDQGQFDQMNVAGFRIDGHAVFVVSELPEADNVAVARSIAPAVRAHIESSGI